MLKLVVLAAASLAVLGGVSPAAAVDCTVGPTVTGFEVLTSPPRAALPRLLVKFPEAGMGMNMLAMEADGPLTLREATTKEPAPPGVTVFEIEPQLGMDSAETESELNALASRLRERGAIFAHPDYIVTAHAGPPNDPCYALQWHYWPHGGGERNSDGGIDAPAAWTTNTGSREVVVAVIDTGLVASHPDFETGNIVPGWDFIDNDGDATDVGPNNHFHGTHVAGTIGALATDNGGGAASVDWQVRIQPVRALDGNGSGSFLGIANAIVWAAGGTLSDGNHNPTPAKVINMSLGGEIACDDINAGAIRDAIQQATDLGALVVVSAGNSNADAKGFTPAGCDGVFTVASTDFVGQRAWYSNFGETVEIAAPGGVTRTPDGTMVDLNGDGHPDGVLSSVNGSYEFFQGTSMAAPHVSGVAALLFARDPSLSPHDAMTKIMGAATPLTCDLSCGVGLLNAAVAQ